jgi:23S rRNA (pseudouridine1915-N3)-methyltransferase
MRLIAVGRLRAGPEAEIFARYAGRLRPGLTVAEITEARGSPAEISRREGEALLAALRPGEYAVALDVAGAALSSEAFAAWLEGMRTAGRVPAFLIGGAEGLSAAVLARADHCLSLGPLIWPHFLVRVLLAEQLYRAQSIVVGHPYHRGGRPGP